MDGGGVDRVAPPVGVGDQRLIAGGSLFDVLDCFQLGSVAEPDGGFEVHAAELGGRPGEGEERGSGAAGHHRLGGESVGLAQDDRESRRLGIGQGDEDVVALAGEAGALDVGADHHPGRVDQHEDGNVEAVAELGEAAELVCAIAVDRSAEMLVVVGDHADRVTFNPDQRGDDADAELAAQFQHRVDVRHLLDHVAHAEGPLAVLGDGVAEEALVDAVPAGDRALEVGEVLPGCGDRLVFVVDEDVDAAGGAEVGHGANLFRREESEAAALDGGRSAHADVGVAGGDDAVGDPQDRGVAGEGATGGDADHRHRAADPRHHVVSRHPLTGGGDVAEVGVAGASAGALGPDD